MRPTCRSSPDSTHPREQAPGLPLPDRGGRRRGDGWRHSVRRDPQCTTTRRAVAPIAERSHELRPGRAPSRDRAPPTPGISPAPPPPPPDWRHRVRAGHRAAIVQRQRVAAASPSRLPRSCGSRSTVRRHGTLAGIGDVGSPYPWSFRVNAIVSGATESIGCPWKDQRGGSGCDGLIGRRHLANNTLAA